LSYTQQLWGLSRSLSGSGRLAPVADQLGALEAVLESELRRAEVIAHELERLSATSDDNEGRTRLSASA
jgi:hypothetical protein